MLSKILDKKVEVKCKDLKPASDHAPSGTGMVYRATVLLLYKYRPPEQFIANIDHMLVISVQQVLLY